MSECQHRWGPPYTVVYIGGRRCLECGKEAVIDEQEYCRSEPRTLPFASDWVGMYGGTTQVEFYSMFPAWPFVAIVTLRDFGDRTMIYRANGRGSNSNLEVDL